MRWVQHRAASYLLQIEIWRDILSDSFNEKNPWSVHTSRISRHFTPVAADSELGRMVHELQFVWYEHCYWNFESPYMCTERCSVLFMWFECGFIDPCVKRIMPNKPGGKCQAEAFSACGELLACDQLSGAIRSASGELEAVSRDNTD